MDGSFLLLLFLFLKESFCSILAFSSHAGLVHRSEVARGAPGSTLLPGGSVGHVVGPAGQTALADNVPDALANSEPGAATVYPLWTSAPRG